jgi:hypothetical protein
MSGVLAALRAYRNAFKTVAAMQDVGAPASEYFAAMRAQRAALDSLTSQIVSVGKPVKMAHRDGRAAAVGADMTGADPFRMTYVDAQGIPSGHAGYRTFEEALSDALQQKYEIVWDARARRLYR